MYLISESGATVSFGEGGRAFFKNTNSYLFAYALQIKHKHYFLNVFYEYMHGFKKSNIIFYVNMEL